jgi:electron transport complex protein RnfC
MLTFLKGTVRSFRHGIHPGDYKALTRDLPIERMPFPDEVVLPLSQHLGAPSRPVVRPGDRVYRGQCIAEASGFVSTALHASVTGTVRTIGPHAHPSGKVVDAVTIARDPYATQALFGEGPLDWERRTPKALVDLVRQGGFVGLGGAAFPTHVKLSVPEGKRARFFIVNAAECEPYLNSDFRTMLEQPEAVFEGVRICLAILGAERAYVGVETNKGEAIDRLRQQMPAGLPCEVVALEPKYPQGAEKMLIDAVLHREVPSGRLPIDVEVVVQNVGTVAALGDYFRYGQPLIERVVTVTGPGIQRPANLLVPVGAKLTDVIDHCGGLHARTRQILFGGPMMGTAQRALDVPVTKGTSGLLFLTDDEVVPRTEYPCIRCLRCVDACPVYLNPSRLGALAKAQHYEAMQAFHVLDCMECGSCSYVCPSNIPLVQRFRVAKGLLREKMERERAQAS